MQTELKPVFNTAWTLVNSYRTPFYPVAHTGMIVDQLYKEQSRTSRSKALVLASLACRSDASTIRPFFRLDIDNEKIIQTDPKYPVLPHPNLFAANLGMVLNVINSTPKLPLGLDDAYNKGMLKERLGIDFRTFPPAEWEALRAKANPIFTTHNDPYVSLYTSVLEAADINGLPAMTANEISQVSEAVLKRRTSWGQRFIGLLTMLTNNFKYIPSTASRRLGMINNREVSSNSVANTLIQGNCTTSTQKRNGINLYAFGEKEYFEEQCKTCFLLQKGCIRGNVVDNQTAPSVFPNVMKLVVNH